ncbi:hypothetical protein BY996DRAFT_6432334 [Phakopsora pachyrhizi]|uniref:Domain of unknown function at the cortex 1 domain-containing protein n=1 Tax=Phakopsora pachyrhizi TaxID=170000 RepID=A0AAV0BKR5_PHAPC|nr:hypothetical protein BY996DRAFT_6432334 [Phakopsora pachyrhizi]CAH7686942.1 hypothetical protein PPACK8108_LOCUS21654 [Phakopsora pachyrhizi]
MKKRGPRIRILAGPSVDKLSRIKVNADLTEPLPIKTNSFEGEVKNFADDEGEIYRDAESKYFLRWTDATWSIQVQGRFLKPTSVDECVFGNVFEKPIRDRLPYGTALALKTISYIDPSLETDLYADQPWAWSPLLATMNYFRTERLESDDSPLPAWNGNRPEEDCTSIAVNRNMNISKPHLRRKFFGSVNNRLAATMGPRINADFANGFLDFSTLSLVVPVVNVSFNLAKLWDGQPVRYICKSRYTNETYFIVEFQIAALEADNNLEEDDEDSDKEQTPEESAAQSRRATRGNSAALRPDDLPPVDDWGVD